MLTLLHRLFHTNKTTFLIYAFIGGVSAVIYMGLFAFFWRGVGLNYSVAITLAYLFAVLFHFFVNRRYTFRSHGANLVRHIQKYLVLLSVNLIITLLVVNFCVKILLLSPYIGAVFSIGIGMMISYVLARHWVFK